MSKSVLFCKIQQSKYLGKEDGLKNICTENKALAIGRKRRRKKGAVKILLKQHTRPILYDIKCHFPDNNNSVCPVWRYSWLSKVMAVGGIRQLIVGLASATAFTLRNI